MDIWMSIFNTPTQGVKNFTSRHIPDENQKEYIKLKFNELIGSIKLFVSLDQGIGFTDNHWLDSGLFRALYKYSNDSDIRRMKEELKDTLIRASDKLLYIYDSRVSSDKPESLIKDRVNLTLGEDHKNFIHSAAFADESNWSGIEDYKALVDKVPEYKDLFGFLIELLQEMPSENVIQNPQKKDSFGRRLDFFYKKDMHKFQDNVGYKINEYISTKASYEEIDRSEFYHFIDSSLHPDTAGALHRLFTDKIYNLIAPMELESNYEFQEWADFSFSGDDLNKIYKPISNSNPEMLQEKQLDANNLSSKGKMFNFLASQNPDTIFDIQKKVRAYLLSEDEKNSQRFATEMIWEMYNSHEGEKLNHQYMNIGLDLVSTVADKVSAITGLGLVIPALKKLHESKNKISFWALATFDSSYKSLIGTFDEILCGKQRK